MMPRMQSIPAAGTITDNRAQAAILSRRSRVGSVLRDLGLYGFGQLVLAAAALALSTVQTGWGERDLSTGTATFGWAIALAALPAWLGLLGQSAASYGSTPGQHAAGLVVEGAALRRVARIVVHPLGALGWAWLALVAALATVPAVPVLLAAAAILVLLGGVISAAMLLRSPDALPLHDRIAGTRLATQ